MSAPLLETVELTAGYGEVPVLSEVDMGLAEGETVAFVGANGAGKTTLLRAIAGAIRIEPGMVRLRERPIGALPADEVAKLGISMVPEGRRLFRSLSVEENLLVGSENTPGRGHWTLETVYRLFPVLRERRRVPATKVSVGQQQMVALGRALMSNPSVLLCDELSRGLPQVVVRDIYAALPRMREAGASVVVVEQDIGQALRIADRVYCMTGGRITLVGRPAHLSRDDIRGAYLGARA